MSTSTLDLSYVTRVNRQPLYFGPNDATLFGWLHTPRETAIGNFTILLCPPLGIDYVNTYPTLRHLADRLAARGIPVLRFDYTGTGNSSGFDADHDRVKHWQRDIRTARDTLQRMTGCAHVGLLGVRVGALLAASATQEMPVDALVLWGPVARGRAYMREMRAMHLTAEGPQTEVLPDGGEIEAGGFVFAAQTAHDLSALALESLRPHAARILLVARDDLPGDQSVPPQWARDGVTIEQRTLPGFSGMLVSPHNSQYRYPHAALQELEQLIAGVAGSFDGKPTTTHLERRAFAEFRGEAAATHAEIRESFFQFGKNQTQFALISEPLNATASNAPWVVLLNSGALHTSGPNRLYTTLARALARAGLCCVRMDFPGVGDSVIAPPGIENSSYNFSNNDEIAALLTALQHERNARQFVLSGLCSGAFASFHGALELKQFPIVEGLLINPLTFYWKEGMSADDPLPITAQAQQQIEQLNMWQYYLGRMRDVRSWKNLLTARSDIGQVSRALAQRARLAIIERIPGKNEASAEEPLARDVRTIIEGHRKLTFVFARTDPGYGLLLTQGGAAVSRYLRNKRITLWFVENTNHTFTNRGPRREFVRSVVDYLVRTYKPRA